MHMCNLCIHTAIATYVDNYICTCTTNANLHVNNVDAHVNDVDVYVDVYVLHVGVHVYDIVCVSVNMCRCMCM